MIVYDVNRRLDARVGSLTFRRERARRAPSAGFKVNIFYLENQLAPAEQSASLLHFWA